MKAKIACVQFDAELMNKEKNLQAMEDWVEKAAKENADLVIFPELALTGYECEDGYFAMAEEFPNGVSLKRMAECAKKNNIYVIFGFVEKAIDQLEDGIYNSVALIGSNGEIKGKYRKVHLVEGVETKWFKRGKEYNVFDTPFGKLGMMICWDTAFPEVARSLALKGAEIIAVPSAWEAPCDGDWDIVQSARSFDNVLYIAACNRVGTDTNLTFFGKSKLVGPIGRTIVAAKDQEEMIVSELDLSVLPELRNGYYVLLKDRQPETYSAITLNLEKEN